MKILNFGSCNVDYVYAMHHIVAPGETQATHSLSVFPGGKGLNQSIAIARAGSTVFHAGCIGADGELLSDILSENGVNLSYLRRVEEKNGHAVIQVSDEGENAIFLYPGSNFMIGKADIDRVLSHFACGDILLLQNEISNVAYLIRQAAARGMSIVFNPAPFTEDLRTIDLGLLSYLILNETEIAGLTGISEPECALQALSVQVPHLKIVLTLGARGGIYKEDAEEIPYPAFSVTPVDTTAAGDTFIGYFVSGLAAGTEICENLRTSAAAAAISVTRMGAAPSIPTKEEVTATMASLRITPSPKERAYAEQIESYLAAHLADATLSALADLLGYSVPYTGKLVRQATGSSFSELVLQKRCERAAALLCTTDLPIEKIIEDLGYNNKSFFRTVFCEKYGKTPLAFRKSHRNANVK